MAVKSTDNNSLFFATGLDNSGLQKGTLDAVGLVQGMAGKIAKINPFAALAVGALTAFATISAGAYKMAKEFEQSMKEVETISDATQKDFKGISSKIFDISKDSIDSPKQLASAYYQVVSAGYDGSKGLELLKIASKAAVAGVTDTKTAVDGLTTILNSYKLDSQDTEKVSDSLFNTVKLGKTTFSELASSISQVAPIASASKIPLNEILSAIASLTKQGVPTAQTMTQIRSAIVGMNEAGKLDGTKTFQENIQSLYNEMKGNQTLIQKEVGRIEAVQAVLALAGKNAQSANNDLKSYNNTLGATEKASQSMLSSNENQWKILRNRIKATTEGIGNAVLSMSNGIVSSLNNALDSSESLREGIVKQRAEFNRLVSELDDVNTGFERKKEILKLLKDSYPGYLKSLDIDKISNQNLSKALQLVKGDLEDINKLHERRIELSAYDDAVSKAQRNKDKAQNTYDDQLEFFNRELKKIENYAADPKNGITLNYKFSDSPQEIFSSVEKSLGGDIGFGKQASLVRDLGDALQVIVNVKPKLEETTKELKEQKKLASNKKLKVFSDEPKDIIDALKKYKDISEVSKKTGVDVTLIDNDKVKEEIGKIRQLDISIDDLKNKFKSKDIPFITDLSKGLDKIKRKDVKEFLSGFDKDYQEVLVKNAKDLIRAPKIKREPITNDDYKNQLKEKEQQYKLYEQYITKLGKEEADKRFNKLLKEGENYSIYLQNELEKFKENEERKDAIVDAAASANVGLKPRERVEALPTIKTAPINLDFKIDTTSYEAVNRKIKELEEKARKSQNAGEQKALGEKIKIEKKKLEAIEKRIYGSKKAEEDFYKIIQSLSRKGLVDKKKELKESQKLLDKNTKEGAKSYEELQDKIRKINEEIGKDIAGIAQEFSTAFSGLSDLFSKFGDEDTAQLFDQLSGVASGIGKIASGDIIGGSLEVLSSAISVEVVSDTAKFEAAIKELEKAIDKLDYVISKSVGIDKIDNRREGIEKQKQLQEELDAAYKAEEKARKQVKFLGIKLWSKGSGSGTDPAKLDELEQKMEDATRKAQELKEQLDELYTGTNEQSIVDTIISGLREGKKDVQDFADDIKSILQNALLQAFQIKYLEDEIDEFYKLFSDAGSDQNYTAEELSNLVNYINSIITGAQDEINAINDVLEQAGIGGLGSGDSQQGLAGAISTITEDTANVLAGTLNSIRIDVANGLEIAERSSSYLAQIVQNTSYNRHLESMDIKLGNIDSKL